MTCASANASPRPCSPPGCSPSRRRCRLETAPVERRELPREYRLDGLVEATQQTTVSAQTSGQVQEVLFDVDDYVTKGQVIVRLKDTEHRARVAQAEASAEAAQARLTEARRDFDRTKGIFAKDLASKATWTRPRPRCTRRRPRRRPQRLPGAGARAAHLHPGQGALLRDRDRAPGPVGRDAQPGQRLMSGISLEQLRVVVDVPQTLIGEVRTSGRARVQQPGNGWIAAEKLTVFPYADPRRIPSAYGWT